MSASVITLYLCYEKPDEAARWLCAAFGFEIENTNRDIDGSTIYISLRAGSTRILIGPSTGTRFDGLIATPMELDGKGTQICYLEVDDVEAHHLAAQLAGAQIETSPTNNTDDRSYYLCRDIEGHLWSFGSDSFDVPATANVISRAPVAIKSKERIKKSRALAATLAVGLVAISTWLVASNSDPIAKAKSNKVVETAKELAASMRIAGVPAAVLPADSSPLRQSGTTAQTAAPVKAIAANGSLEKSVRETKAKLDALRQQMKKAEGALLDERATSKAALHEKQKVNAKLQKDVEHAHQQFADVRNKAAMLNRARRRAMDKATDSGKKLRDVKRRYGKLMIQLQSVRTELQASRRAEAAVGATLVAERAAARQAKEDGAVGDARQLEISRAVESIVQQLKDEHQSTRKARQILEAASKRIREVHDQTAVLGRTVESLRGMVQTSSARLETQLSALAIDKVKAPQSAGAVGRNEDAPIAATKAKPKPALPKPDDERAEDTKAKPTKTDSKEEKAPAKVLGNQKVATVSAQHSNVQAITTKPEIKTEEHKALPANLALNSRCSRMAWSRIFKHRRSSSAGTVRIINRLCTNARSSPEPIKCLQHIMAGKVNWGNGKRWPMRYALRLCSGTHQASATIGCFRGALLSNLGWRSAISQCAKN